MERVRGKGATHVKVRSERAQPRLEGFEALRRACEEEDGKAEIRALIEQARRRKERGESGERGVCAQ